MNLGVGTYFLHFVWHRCCVVRLKILLLATTEAWGSNSSISWCTNRWYPSWAWSAQWSK